MIAAQIACQPALLSFHDVQQHDLAKRKLTFNRISFLLCPFHIRLARTGIAMAVEKFSQSLRYRGVISLRRRFLFQQ